MAVLKKYNLSGKEVGEVNIEDAFWNVEANPQMIKDYIVALRANARQYSASTKTRSEVKHTTKKPHPQKGTGAARQGSLVSAQFRGGGIVFGPRPKFNQHVRINKKERRRAVLFLLGEKMRENRLVIVEDSAFTPDWDKPSTKNVTKFLKARNMTGRRVLFIGEGSYSEQEVNGNKVVVSTPSDAQDVFKLSMRNLPGSIFSLASAVNGYDLMVAHEVVMTESALQELKKLLVG